ncbi:MAG: DUF934 domain-containing protein [Marivivens sp.]|jgi:uncharacterized protein (DUF934 family)|uniref:DUF934 domain-containing protein n=1 Tax=Marivivens sp. TaxID=1978374 RepID=UPI00201F67EE|nr:DUF934 domain-containing protein [Marivivens sp.]MCL7405689.1 DUF934 domain-containing protein [Marivivens geojensis]NBX09136.1 DUF934 domain-containing protein [Marivivens sp.]
MTVIVTDTGFAADDHNAPFTALGEAAGETAILIPSNSNPADLPKALSASVIAVEFPSFADGRGFTLAAQLRRLGFKGRLRAQGHVICEQYAMARRSGFDEVAISDELAARQPENLWLTRANWQANDYQARMRG